jgi:hypothetical protein
VSDQFPPPRNQPPYGGQQPPFQPPPGYGPQPPFGPYVGQQPQYGPPPGRRARKPRRGLKVSGGIIYSLVLLGIGIVIGNAGGSSPSSNLSTSNATQNTPAPQQTQAQSATTQPAAASAPQKHVLIRFAGSGIKNSAPFNVGSGPLTVTYTFNCSSFGQSGNFQADLLYGNQASLNSDDDQIANDLALHGGQTTTVYPQDAGKAYYLSVNSECSWRIKVVGR